MHMYALVLVAEFSHACVLRAGSNNNNSLKRTTFYSCTRNKSKSVRVVVVRAQCTQIKCVYGNDMVLYTIEHTTYNTYTHTQTLHVDCLCMMTELRNNV